MLIELMMGDKMKSKYAVLALLLLTGQFLFAGDLFFSEYIEGASNNKALEIYNGTENPVDLINYRIAQSSNGDGWEYYHVWSSSTILQANDVWVITTDAADAALKSVADEILAYPSVVHFNGNDARGLEVTSDGGTNWTLIDVIGVPDQDVKWAVAGVAGATAEHTLVRKSTVLSGNTDWAASAGTDANDSEWMVYDQDTFGFLGAHVAGSSENIPPFAKAGEDKVVGYDSMVTLDGSKSSDPDGVIVSYLWSQFSGVSVTLANADQSIASFTAPGSDAVLVFTLTVTDDSSATAIDTVAVSVVDGSPSPIFFSEYVEGSSYNKAIEIYNASESSVDLSNYVIRGSSAGGGWLNTYYEFPTGISLEPGDVYVIASDQASSEIQSVADEVLAYNAAGYVVGFNGDDARGLFRNGLLVDAIGEPENSDKIIENLTLRRKNTVLVGNPIFDFAEWDQFEIDNIEDLGTHSANPDAPSITNVALSQDFITSSMEIEISATITPVEGQTITTAKIKYGVDGILNNETDMWQDNGNVWMGNIPAQAAYTELEYQVVAWDGADNYGESAKQKVLIADAILTDLSAIRTNKAQYLNKMITVKGVVTIGSGVLDGQRTKVYIQDESGRGINLFAYDLIPGLDRGDELVVVGEVAEYNNVLEIINFQYKENSTGNSLPEAKDISLTEANSLEYEGTWVKFDGIIADTTFAGGGTTLTIELGGDTSFVRIWNTTGIDISSYTIGTSYWFSGVINPYYDNFQLLVGYAEDIQAATGIEDAEIPPNSFRLNPAYPNPFNPVTQLAWQLDRAGDYELSAYNVLGQKVSVISEGFGQPGTYSYRWNAGDLPTGVYYIQLKSGVNKQTQKVLLLK
jgi:predicted extracellular nuclease